MKLVHAVLFIAAIALSYLIYKKYAPTTTKEPEQFPATPPDIELFYTNVQRFV